MLKCYYVDYRTVVKGYQVGNTQVTKLVTCDTEMKNETVSFTWENLDELYEKYGCQVAFVAYNKRKGQLISFVNCNPFKKETRDIKEWKEPVFDLKLEIEYTEYTPTIDEVLHWYDGDMAIQYLVERGLSVVRN